MTERVDEKLNLSFLLVLLLSTHFKEDSIVYTDRVIHESLVVEMWFQGGIFSDYTAVFDNNDWVELLKLGKDKVCFSTDLKSLNKGEMPY